MRFDSSLTSALSVALAAFIALGPGLHATPLCPCPKGAQSGEKTRRGCCHANRRDATTTAATVASFDQAKANSCPVKQFRSQSQVLAVMVHAAPCGAVEAAVPAAFSACLPDGAHHFYTPRGPPVV